MQLFTPVEHDADLGVAGQRLEVPAVITPTMAPLRPTSYARDPATPLAPIAGTLVSTISLNFEATRLVVEVSQIVVHEGDDPDALAHLGHPHILPSKDVAEIDLAAAETDAPAARDGDRVIVTGIGEVLKPR